MKTYYHFIAVDWAQGNMAIARMTAKSDRIKVVDVKADINELRIFLKSLKGTVALAIEEGTTAQWLYMELRDCVDKLLICDPYRNALLSEGSKTDKIDARKLVQLFKAGLLKEVFHSCDEYLELRKLTSGYDDVVRAGVRMKNQRSAIFRSEHKDHKKDIQPEGSSGLFVLSGLDASIAAYEEEKKRYETKFQALKKKHKAIALLTDIPGIGIINAVRVVARVVDAKRFSDRNHWLSYCGLIKLERQSGGKTYGKKTPRYCREMKSVFKIAALAANSGTNEFSEHYNYLISEKNHVDYIARHSVARRIATIVLGILKSGKKYQPFRERKKNVDKELNKTTP